MIYTELTKKAMRLCFEKHKHAVSKDGIPYPFHPFHVAESMKDEATTCAALLHDILEDTDVTAEQLLKMGFSTEIVDALCLLTYDKTVPYLDYVASVKSNPIALAVKLSDLRHNSDLTRLDQITMSDLKRFDEKYFKALVMLQDIRIEKIYFDMDGVLADFAGGLRSICGLEPLDQQAASKEQDDTMWEAIRNAEHFYDRLEPMPGALDMFRTLYAKYGDKCEILSAVPKKKRGIITASGDKVNWAARMLNVDLKVNIVHSAEAKKSFAKGSGYLLIDDLPKNIGQWIAAGGTGVRFDTAEGVMERIRMIEG